MNYSKIIRYFVDCYYIVQSRQQGLALIPLQGFATARQTFAQSQTLNSRGYGGWS